MAETSSLLGTVIAVVLSVLLGVSPGVEEPTATLEEVGEAPVEQVAPLDPEAEPEVIEAETVAVYEVWIEEPRVFEPEAAVVEVVTGQIAYEDEVVSYQLTPQHTGRFTFEFNEMYAGFEPNLGIYDHLGQRVGGSSYGTGNGISHDYELQAGETYTVEVKQYSGTGSFELSIGTQRETFDLTEVDLLRDEISFDEQELYFTFTAAETGTHRFEVAEMMVDCELTLVLYDRLGQKVASTSYGAGNGGGITAKLEAGETYRLLVKQYAGHCAFDLHIGRQAGTVDLTDFDAIVDAISFQDQVNVYTLEVAEPGTYTFTLEGMQEDFAVNVKVTNRLGETVGKTSYGAENGDGLEVDLVPGETYTVKVTWYQGTGSYELWLEQIAWG